MGNCYSNGANREDMDERSLILSKTDILAIRNSWVHVAADNGLVKNGTNMMMRIFIEHKEMKPLWKFARDLETREQMHGNATLKAHGEKLFNAIDLAVSALDDLQTLVPVLIQLGYSHYGWGVREKHFAVIGEVLIGTLQDGLKELFTPKVKKAYLIFFSVVESQMKIGMKQAESEIIAAKQKSNQTNHIHDSNNNTNNNTNTSANNSTNNHLNNNRKSTTDNGGLIANGNLEEKT